jgi:hypothetical protein
VGWTPSNPLTAVVPVAAKPNAVVPGATAAAATPVSTVATIAAPSLAIGTPIEPRKLNMQLESVLVGRNAFEVGEQIFLSASLNRASYMYCFLHEAGGTVMRLLPNATNPSALISANQAVRIPDWMSPTPGFIMDATSAGTEHVACFATDQDVTAKLPKYLGSTPLEALANVRDIKTIKEGFVQAVGEGNYTVAQLQWNVVAKKAAEVAPAAAKK